jgi:hypothetical protein
LALAMLPHDTFDQQLLANVRPPGWCNPKPEGRYNLVVIGVGVLVVEVVEVVPVDCVSTAPMSQPLPDGRGRPR